MNAASKFNLPHFRLAKAKRIDPNLLLKSSKDELGALFLALSTVLNDMKGMIWLDQLLIDNLPNKSDPIETPGQWHGMQEQVTKYLLGIVHEFLVLLKKKRQLIESDDFESLVRRLPRQGRKKWRTLVRVALSKGSVQNDSFARSLARIRNNLSFHYHDPQTLAKGYLAHFDNTTNDETQVHAFISHGRNMALSRYYYADAAVEKAIEFILDSRPGARETHKIIEDINLALSGLILAFIESRDPSFNSR